MEEFIPTFEEKKDNNLLAQIDEFEDKIKLIDKLTKEYDEIKKELKKQMVEIGKENESTQVKWITPNGIQITCSIGKKPKFEKQEYEEFNLLRFKEEQPQMYEQYLEKRTKEVAVQSASYDRLVITLPKEEK